MKQSRLLRFSAVALLSAVLLMGAGCGKKAATNKASTSSGSAVNTESVVGEPTGDANQDQAAVEDALQQMQSASDSASATLDDVEDEDVDAYSISEDGL